VRAPHCCGRDIRNCILTPSARSTNRRRRSRKGQIHRTRSGRSIRRRTIPDGIPSQGTPFINSPRRTRRSPHREIIIRLQRNDPVLHSDSITPNNTALRIVDNDMRIGVDLEGGSRRGVRDYPHRSSRPPGLDPMSSRRRRSIIRIAVAVHVDVAIVLRFGVGLGCVG
jgi:hypothetical protein